jgi:hypothetical protein
MYGGHIKSGSATSLSVLGSVGSASVSHSHSHHHSHSHSHGFGFGHGHGGHSVAGGQSVASAGHSALPFTGFDSLKLALIALVLVVGGLLLMRMVMLISSDH